MGSSIEKHPNPYATMSDHLHNQEYWAIGATNDCEGDEHDGREPGEDDEPALGWNASVDQTDSGAGSMHTDEMEPSLGSTSTINQEAWAFGLSNDREQGTTRNFARKAPVSSSDDNLTWPDGSPFDPVVMKPEFCVTVVSPDGVPCKAEPPALENSPPVHTGKSKPSPLSTRWRLFREDAS